jgi:hypothetical protein
MELWQISMLLLGGVLFLAYLKRRSDRLSRSED